MNLIFGFFRLPWWGLLIACLSVLALTEFFYQEELRYQQDYAAAQAAPVPPVVDLSDFRKAEDIHLTREVHVAGWINTDQNYELTLKKNGITKETGFMYVLYGSQDDPGASTARAAIIMTPAEKARYVSWLAMAASGFPALSEEDQRSGVQPHPAGLQLNGRSTSPGRLGDLAKDAFAELGVTRSKDFIFLDPFWQGRDAGMARSVAPDSVRDWGWRIAAVIGLLSVLKLRRARTRKAKQLRAETTSQPQTPQQAPKTAPAQDPFAESPILSGKQKTRFSGLRLTRRQAGQKTETATASAPIAATQSAHQPTDPAAPTANDAEARLKAFVDFRFQQMEEKQEAQRRKDQPVITPQHRVIYAIVVSITFAVLSVFEIDAVIPYVPVALLGIVGLQYLAHHLGWHTPLFPRRTPLSSAPDPFDRLKHEAR